MRAILFCFLLLGFQTRALCQGKVLLQDDFSSNKNGWRLQKNAQFIVRIQNGVLHLEKVEKNFTSRGCLWYNKTIPRFSTLKDFSITIYARFVSGGDIFDMIDLQWGARHEGPVNGGRTNDSLYQLSFLLRGEVKLDYFNRNSNYYVKKNIKALLDDNNFNGSAFNKYELVQKNGFLVFNVNDKELMKQLYEPIPGNSIGFQQCLKSAWEIDKIIIRQLDAEPKITMTADSLRVILPAQSDLTEEKGLKIHPNPFENTMHVIFSMEKDETVQLVLIDMSGGILQQHTRKLQRGTQDIAIYADVAPGSYIVRVQAGNEKAMTATIVKQ